MLTTRVALIATLRASTSYGKTAPTSYTGPEVQEINRIAPHFGAALRPGAYLVGTYPFLRYIPGYLRHLYRYHEEELAFFHGMVAYAKSKMERPGTFVAYLFNEKSKSFGYRKTRWHTSQVLCPGWGWHDRPCSQHRGHGAAFHLDAQARVQARLDKVVGRDGGQLHSPFRVSQRSQDRNGQHRHLKTRT
ncbi:uncharacterized protein B0H18DRAFT_1207587 [Fomitopsis serialis]|uniref:uncharacterized protein n=1 Tax=Fomitopsis serialis TaxID=139415 RepID=UPI002007BCEB|nr:uncharacterized protein B0H18DRAFT_1207587 [Neoantrodia serialis]KAH9934954.1 hypothetical protein B0H18DRAFT_1207587 [Neoantrodia serialis]